MQSNIHTHIDLSIYSNSSDYEKEWTIVHRNKTHDIFIINKETHFILKMKEISCKKYGIKSHTINRLLAEYVKNNCDFHEEYIKIDIQELKNLAESHFRVIREKQSELECGFLYADSDFEYYEIEFPLKYLHNDLDNLRDEFGIVEADIIWESYVPVGFERTFDNLIEIKDDNQSDISYENIDSLLNVENIDEELEEPESIHQIMDTQNQEYKYESTNKTNIDMEEIEKQIIILQKDIKLFSQDVSDFSMDIKRLNMKIEFLKMNIDSTMRKYEIYI